MSQRQTDVLIRLKKAVILTLFILLVYGLQYAGGGKLLLLLALPIFAFLYFYFEFTSVIVDGLQKLHRHKGEKEHLPACSVVIPFRNEERNIPGLIDSLTRCTYPRERYEVILVNDHSADKSAVLLREAGLTVHDLPDGVFGKKAALSMGIGKSCNAIILCTDADCNMPADWITAMMKNFTPQTGFVSGPVCYDISSGTLLARMLQLEHMGLVLTGGGLIGSGDPLIANGANMAFRKDLFEAIQGFSGSVSPSGDDEWIMRRIEEHTVGSVTFCTNPHAVVTTEAPATIRALFRQRSRWASKSLLYRKEIVGFMLFPLFLFLLCDIFLWILLILNPFSIVPIIRVLATVCKAVFEYRVLVAGKSIFKQPLAIPVHLLTSMLHSFYIVFVTVKGVLGNADWKGRAVR